MPPPMSLRDVVAGAARASAGVWQGVADAIEPVQPSGSAAVPDPVDLTDEPAGSTAPAVRAVASGEAMLVPLDSWTRVLDQLGNLHEAGQQLAEARERAVKAETEAAFLRQQLAEVKPRTEPSPEADVPRHPSIDSTRPRSAVGDRVRDAAVRTRRRARTWIRR